jgi:hypothetical protein
MVFEIVYSPEAVDHLRALPKNEVQEDPVPAVIIKAVGIKRHNELWLGQEQVEL